MRISAIMLLPVIFLTECMGQKKEETVFKEYDSLGRIVQRWGNENTWDNNVNFREFYFYDLRNGRLIRKLYYDFEDENTECLISESDSLRYTEFKYVYDNDVLVLEQRYDPVIDENSNVIDHKLTYVFNHILRREDESSPTYGK